MSGHSIQEMLAWVGLTWEIIRSKPVTLHPVSYMESADTILENSAEFAVKVSSGGRVSHGYGSTLESALCDAARGHDIDWRSVECRMTEDAWAAIAHC